jgi:DNA invertase Pin-like site-specific DNA recombinase
MIDAAIYARTSPDCTMSADEQIKRLQAIAYQRGWTVAHIFTDRPTSVRKGQDRRSGEVALIDLIRRGAIDRVLICSVDRIGKSLVELVTFMEACRMASVSLWLDQQGLDTAGSNGLPLFDVMEMMAFHVHQTRRDRILRGQAAVRGLVRFGRPPIPTTKMMRAKQELAAGKGVRQVARLAGISPASVSRLKNSMGPAVATV